MRTIFPRGNTLTIVTAVVAAGGVLWAATTAMHLSPAAPATLPVKRAMPVPLTAKRHTPAPIEVRAALAKTGLMPDVLTASGVQSSDVSALVSNTRDYLGEHGESIGSAETTYISAQQTLDALQRLIQEGHASPEQRSSLASVKEARDSARSARDAAISALRDAAVDDLTQEQKAAVGQIRSNAWLIPVQYKLATRTPAQWRQLRSALANERTSAAAGKQPDSACHTLVTEANAVTATYNAAQYLRDRLEGVTTAYRQAIGN